MQVQTFLPDWVPAWVQLALLILGILFALAFLMMPFSVFGVKARLEALELRLDEIQGEIRSLALRLPEADRLYEEPLRTAPRDAGPQSPSRAYAAEEPSPPRAPMPREPQLTREPAATPRPAAAARPPIPPASWTPDGVVRRPIGAPPPRGEKPPRGKSEPRLW